MYKWSFTSYLVDINGASIFSSMAWHTRSSGMRTPTFFLEAYLAAAVPYRIHCLGRALLAVKMKVYCYRKKLSWYYVQLNSVTKATHHNNEQYLYSKHLSNSKNNAVIMYINSISNLLVQRNKYLTIGNIYRTRQAMFNSSKNVCTTLAIATRKSCSVCINVFERVA